MHSVKATYIAVTTPSNHSEAKKLDEGTNNISYSFSLFSSLFLPPYSLSSVFYFSPRCSAPSNCPIYSLSIAAR